MAGLFHLKQLGVQQAEQRPLLLPVRYEDAREPVDPGQVDETGREVYLEAAVVDAGRVHMGRFWAALRDDAGRDILIDGPPALQEELGPIFAQMRRVHLLGYLAARRKDYVLSEPRWLPEAERGQVIPVYPGLTRMSDTAIREQVQENLTEDVARTAAWLLQRLRAAGITVDEGWLVKRAGSGARALAEALYRIHRPQSPEQGWDNIHALERLVAWLRGAEARSARPQPTPELAFDVAEGALAGYLSEADQEPTEEQSGVLGVLEAGLRSEMPLHHLLSGAVGSGKITLLGAALMAVARAGGRAGLLVPGEAIGEQVVERLRRLWPEQGIYWGLPDPDSGPPAREVVVDEPDHLGSAVEDFDFLVVLELQSYDPDLRARLLTANVNLLAVTPEAVPLVAALLRYEGLKPLRLQQTLRKRSVGVEILERERDAQVLKRGIQQTLRQDGQVLVMHPGPGAVQSKERQGPEGAQYRVWERQFPEQMVQLTAPTGAKKLREMTRNIRMGQINVVFCEPERETAVYLPRLRQVIVLQAERFSRTDLQRLRARVAPFGGIGRLDLICDRPDDAAAVERLQALRDVTDAEALVLADYREGLGGEGWLLPGRPPNLQELEAVADSEWGSMPWEQ